MFPLRKALKYTTITGCAIAAAGVATSLNSNPYQLDSIGIVRFCKASYCAISIVVYYKQSIYSKKWDWESPEYLEVRSKVHKKAALKLLDLCQQNKGVYVKVGQHIGALDYILPSEYVDTMKVLHSHAPESSLEDVYKVFQEDMHLHPSEVFEHIDPTPLGAASLAQVHKATLKDGRVIALKVQHATVKRNSIVDLKTMEILAKAVAIVLPDFKVQWLVDETKRNIPRELDFSMEAENTEKARKMFGHLKWLKIPRVHQDLCSPRVLALEFVDGGFITDLEYMKRNGINPYEVSDKLGQLYSEMIFKTGFVHSDPHPGNILVKKDAKGGANIILLDHGLYATLTENFRYEYAQLWLSILDRNKVKMKEHCATLGVEELYWLFSSMVSGRTWDAIESGLVTTTFSKNEKELFQKELPNLLAKITQVLSTVDRQMFLVFKTNDLLRGIEHSLNTFCRMESFMNMSRSCIITVYNERTKKCGNRVEKWKTSLAKGWALMKISFYYKYLYICSLFSFNRGTRRTVIDKPDFSATNSQFFIVR